MFTDDISCCTSNMKVYIFQIVHALMFAIPLTTQNYPIINNACKRFADFYLNFETNTNCYFNPDVYLEFPDIVKSRGYPVKIYTIITPDQYIETVFRIPHGRKSNRTNSVPVFLQHGLMSSSILFVNKGNNSLAFVLADAGYDVWLGNARGTRYSNNHVKYEKFDPKFWNFTLHEVALFDLPTQLDLVVQKTQSKVVYIGYSQGTTNYFIYSSTLPQDAARKIRFSISLAPVAFLKYVSTPARILLPFSDLLVLLFQAITNGSLLQRTPQLLQFLEMLCFPSIYQMRFCKGILMIFNGFDFSQENPETIATDILQDIDAASIKLVHHYIQILKSGEFQQYNYDQENRIMYGAVNPPLYNLTKIIIPNYFIQSENDPLATLKNVQMTYNSLAKEARPFNIYTVKRKLFSHIDFVQAKDIQRLLFNHLVWFLKTQIATF